MYLLHFYSTFPTHFVHLYHTFCYTFATHFPYFLYTLPTLLLYFFIHFPTLFPTLFLYFLILVPTTLFITFSFFTWHRSKCRKRYEGVPHGLGNVLVFNKMISRFLDKKVWPQWQSHSISKIQHQHQSSGMPSWCSSPFPRV